MKPHPDHSTQQTRLRRIEGQVRGIQRMIEEGRYCIDIIDQIHAITAALRKVESNGESPRFQAVQLKRCQALGTGRTHPGPARSALAE